MHIDDRRPPRRPIFASLTAEEMGRVYEAEGCFYLIARVAPNQIRAINLRTGERYRNDALFTHDATLIPGATLVLGGD